MTEFLIHKFIPNAEDVYNPMVRERYGRLASIVGMLCNAFLCTLKLCIGAWTHSIAITADAVNNLSDGLSSLIALIGFRLSAKEPDKSHPFGYGRTEYIAGFVVAFFIVQVGFEFLKTSVNRIFHPAEVSCSWTLLFILTASLLLKLWMGIFNRKLGQRIQSATLLAAMQDSLNDVITTAVVIAGMIASRFTRLPIDGYIGILVAGFILWSGIHIAKDTLSPLLGEAADPEIAQKMKQLVLSLDGIVGTHDLIIHNYGAGKSLASLHAEVPDSSDFVKVHEVIDNAERQIYEQLGIYAVIHMDPISVNNARVNALHKIVIAELLAIDARLTMHDFRVVDGEQHINLIFDVIVPFDYKNNQLDDLRRQITDALRQRDSRFRAIITLDRQM